MRLSVGTGTRLMEATQFNADLGGAESNVCCALAGLGRRAAWFGRLPDSPLGHWALRLLRASGVHVAGSSLIPHERLGVYFVELGVPPHSVEVIYDRANSAFSKLSPGDVDWDQLLDTHWLHLTGITPALGDLPAATIIRALELAATRGVQVSFDVNFRSKLWTASQALAWLSPRLKLIDLLICGRQDAQAVFGLRGDPTEVAMALAERTRSGRAVVTLQQDGAVAWDSGKITRLAAHKATVVDRLGAGDAFAAGLLDGLLDGQLEAGLERGVALGAAALAQRGDVLCITRAEMERLVAREALTPLR